MPAPCLLSREQKDFINRSRYTRHGRVVGLPFILHYKRNSCTVSSSAFPTQHIACRPHSILAPIAPVVSPLFLSAQSWLHLFRASTKHKPAFIPPSSPPKSFILFRPAAKFHVSVARVPAFERRPVLHSLSPEIVKKTRAAGSKRPISQQLLTGHLRHSSFFNSESFVPPGPLSLARNKTNSAMSRQAMSRPRALPSASSSRANANAVMDDHLDPRVTSSYGDELSSSSATPSRAYVAPADTIAAPHNTMSKLLPDPSTLSPRKSHAKKRPEGHVPRPPYVLFS